ncbi:MAG: hypothetical protein AABM32_10020 [Chloroflexota bacterium]
MERLENILATPLNATAAVTLATLAVAFVIAEQFYKFHSFTLETLAFLGTWWVLRRASLFFVPR